MPKAYGKTFKQLTKEDIETIARSDLTTYEICDLIGIKPTVTLSRWRKQLGISVPKGCKPGKERPWRIIPREIANCKNCNKEVSVIPKYKEKFKYCSRKCQFENPDHINMLKNIDRSYMYTDEYRKIMSNPDASERKRYGNIVHKLTSKNYELHKDEINPNTYPRTVCGIEGGYQLDHIISIKFGFENNILPEVLAEKSNLRMLPWKENLMRNYLKD
jgi:hypothetical protein